MYVVTWNVRGMKDIDCMRDVIEIMKRKNVGIAVLIETHFDNHDCPQFCSIASEFGYKCFHTTRLMKRGDHGSGGVSIMVEESLKCRVMRKSELEDSMWICVEFENERVFVGGVYLVPPSSSRARKADELVEEIGRDVARFNLAGQVILVGDWNCKIGTMESIAQERVFLRKSVSESVDRRGKRMIELLNLSDVVVLNGVQEANAQYTCKAARGDGINDYVAISCALVERTSELDYWKEHECEKESDHVAIGCRVRLRKEQIVCEKTRKEKRKEKQFQNCSEYEIMEVLVHDERHM